MKRTLTISVLLLFAGAAVAQKKTDHYWGQKGYDVAYSSAATSDGGYVITGLTQSGADTTGDIIVIKVTATGDTQWTMTKGGPKLEGGNNVIQTADGGYLVSGHTQDFGADDCDAFMMKLDQNGKEQWLHVYGGEFDDIADATVELKDGSFVIAGITASYGNNGLDGNRHVFFVKTDNTGNKIWDRYYAGSGSEYAYSIAPMPQGGFLAVGYTSSFGKGELDGWILRLNDNGDTLWTRLYQKEGNSRFFRILPTMDNGYMLAGFSTATMAANPQGLIVKLDADGKELWERTFGDAKDTVMLRDAAQTPNGNFMFTGTSYERNQNGEAYVLVTDMNGNKISEEECGGSRAVGNSISLQGNNGYLVAGSSVAAGDPYADMYYRTVNNTMTGLNNQSIATAQLYPNPVSGQPAIIVLPQQEAAETVVVEVSGMSGKLLLTQNNVPAKNIVIEKNLPAGEYLYKVTCKDGKVYKGKFVME